MNLKATVLLLALFGASWALHAEPLGVKPGLWETTTTTEKKGAKAPTNLDQLSAEQRAKVEKKLAAQAKKETRTTTSCLKEAKIKSGEAFMGRSHHGACTRKAEVQTAGEWVTRVECKGINPMTGKVTMRAADPEHMSGLTEITYGESDKQQLLTRSEVSARWIGADCAQNAAAPANPHGSKP